ncbi:hypothetical protein PENSTE_c027G06618 [Penicillium steckii]|uniref:LITAF domain-containing protein n=1 Tax=Penicillium steckii TaxID=303698 RepID=A0A1V6SPT2_9EURO|nr:hypothetical protein PENSTE_c027G06618 [Penicillium steckii]
MDHKETAPAVNQPTETTTTTTQDSSLTTQTPETTANPSPAVETTTSETTRAADEQIQAVAPHAQPPPTYQETAPPQEKTAWQAATQAPTPQPGQGLVVSRTVELNQLNEEPRLINCPFCYQEAMTRVQKESTSATGMAAVGCCLLGGICFAFLPFCMEMCHDSHHFCTKCNKLVAIRAHDGPVQLFSPQPPVVAAPEAVQPPKPVAMTQDTSVKH